jgi:hypothetical protein
MVGGGRRGGGRLCADARYDDYDNGRGRNGRARDCFEQ